MTTMAEARSLLLQATNSKDLSPAQKSAMHEVAWKLAPCTCGKGPGALTHRLECLHGEYTPTEVAA